MHRKHNVINFGGNCDCCEKNVLKLSLHIRLTEFRRLLKTFLFAETRRIVISLVLMAPGICTLTYLQVRVHIPGVILTYTYFVKLSEFIIQPLFCT